MIFFAAENAIQEAKKANDIIEWGECIASSLQISTKEYSKKQIDLVVGLILYEQVARDSSYNDIFCGFTEVYKSKWGLF